MAHGSAACGDTEVHGVRLLKAETVPGVVPFLIMGVVALGAVVFHQDLDWGGLSLLSLGPVVAVIRGVGYTIVSCCLAMVLCVGIASSERVIAKPGAIMSCAVVAGVSVAAVIASVRLRGHRQELAQVTAIAEVTQQVLFRPVPAGVGLLRLAVSYMSATSFARIGGDLYDVVPTGHGLRLIIGDVQGKGLSAVQTAATVLGSFRETAYDAPDLAVIAHRIEISLARQLSGERFVTAVLAHVTPDGSNIELLNCGHPPPLLVCDGESRFVEPGQSRLPLGLAQLAESPCEPDTITLDCGDSILFYTDGITEARNQVGEFFTLTSSCILSEGHDPERALAHLSSAVVCHVGHALDDDAAMLLLHRTRRPHPG
jgi:serine phosphatase RsbU (regulator of sigma subunit)